MNRILVASSPLHNECDQTVWRDLKNGNKDALAVIYYRYFVILLHRGLSITGDREMVKDCLHDLFLDIWEKKMNLSEPESVKAYLIASLQRKILRKLKKNRQHNYDPEGLESECVLSHEDTLISEQQADDNQHIVKQAVDSLTKRQKEVIRLKFYSNLSYEEIAELMQIGTDSIYNLVSKALNNMHNGLIKKLTY